MHVTRSFLLAALMVLFASSPAWAAEGEEEQFSAVHHSADGYYLDISPMPEIELPRIFLVREADGSLGLDIFLSTAAALRSGEYIPHLESGHGEAAASEVAEEEEHAASPSGYGADRIDQIITEGEHLEANLTPATGHIILDLSITRHLFFALLAALIVASLFIGLARKYKRGVGRETAPRGIFQNMMETIIVFIRDEVAKPTLGDNYQRFLPFLLSLFFFILTCNLLGLVPFGVTATSNIMVTAVLAIFTFVVTQFNASKEHWEHIFWPPGVPWYIKPIMIPIEIIGLFTKPFALAVRLFANMTAGHLIILSLIGLIFIFGDIFGQAAGYGVSIISVSFSLFLYLLEILVAFIQAYIFVMLSSLFIGMATVEHEEHDHREMGQGDTPKLQEDHGDVTPHPLSGDRGDDVEKKSTVETPEPAAA